MTRALRPQPAIPIPVWIEMQGESQQSGGHPGLGLKFSREFNFPPQFPAAVDICQWPRNRAGNCIVGKFRSNRGRRGSAKSRCSTGRR